jgi:hypothetical protein
LSIASARNAPPGAMTTAVPVAIAGSGRKTVSVGSLTLATTRSPDGEAVTVSATFQS